MAWDPKYPAFGVIKIDKDKVHLYSSRDNYTTISVSKPVTNAVWAGSFLNVRMADGRVRRYSSRDSYSTIKKPINCFSNILFTFKNTVLIFSPVLKLWKNC